MKANTCVTRLVEHIVHATAKIFQGTTHEDTWMFYHDALSQIICRDTLNWMKEKDYFKRWILPLEGINDGTSYAGQPFGNSPEVMPLNFCLNEDIQDSLRHNQVVPTNLQRNDLLNFFLSNPNRIDSAVVRLFNPSMGPL